MKSVSLILLILLLCLTSVIGCTTSESTPPASSATPSTTAPLTTQTPSTPTAPATTTLAIPTTAPATAPISKTTSPAAGPNYGGLVKWLDATAPGSPIGVPWESKMGIPCQGLVLEYPMSNLRDGTLLPKLAQSWDIDTGTNPSFTFHLGKGVKFHDGTDFTAKTMAWNLQKTKDAGLWASTRYYKSFDVIDDYTLKVPLTQWRNSILPAWYTYPMISPTSFEKNGIEWSRWNMVGTGPYKQVEFKRDEYLKTVRNDNYWDKGKPYLFQAQYIFVSEELTRVALFKTGGADILNTARNARVASEFKAEGHKIVSVSSGAICLLPDSANANSPWANLKVREAAEYAIDKSAITKAFGYGFFQPSYQLPLPDSPAYSPDFIARKFDLAKAKQLLAEAGYPNGFKTKIIAQSTANRDVIVALQSHLKAVGIDADLDFPEPAKFVSYQQGSWDNALMVQTIGMGAYPNQTFGATFASPRVTGRSNANPPNWKELYEETMHTPTPDAKVIQKCVQALIDDVTVIPIYYEYDMYVVNDKLHGYGLGEEGRVGWTAAETWWAK